MIKCYNLGSAGEIKPSFSARNLLIFSFSSHVHCIHIKIQGFAVPQSLSPSTLKWIQAWPISTHLIRWGPPSSASLTMAAQSSAPILAPALVNLSLSLSLSVSLLILSKREENENRNRKLPIFFFNKFSRKLLFGPVFLQFSIWVFIFFKINCVL